MEALASERAGTGIGRSRSRSSGSSAASGSLPDKQHEYRRQKHQVALDLSSVLTAVGAALPLEVAEPEPEPAESAQPAQPAESASEA